MVTSEYLTNTVTLDQGNTCYVTNYGAWTAGAKKSPPAIAAGKRSSVFGKGHLLQVPEASFPHESKPLFVAFPRGALRIAPGTGIGPMEGERGA